MARKRMRSSKMDSNVFLDDTPHRARSPSVQRSRHGSSHGSRRSVVTSPSAAAARQSSKERYYSSTRSGLQYSTKRTGGGGASKAMTSSVRRSESWTEDERDAREMKRREYAGMSTGYKESTTSSRHHQRHVRQQRYDDVDGSRLHHIDLYGLDDGGEQYSDAGSGDDSLLNDSTDSSLSYRRGGRAAAAVPQSSSFTLFTRRIKFFVRFLHRYGSLMSRALWQGICFIILSPYYLLIFTANYFGTVFNATVERVSWLSRRLSRYSGRTLVADAALLRGKNNSGLCVYLPLLILLPLLLSGGYYLYQNKVARKSLWDSNLSFYPKRSSSPLAGSSGLSLSASEREIRSVLAAMLDERDDMAGNKQESIYLELLTQQAKLEKELALLAAQVKSQGDEENRQFAIYSSQQDTQANQISSVNDRLLKLEVQIKELQSGHDSLKMQGDLDRRHAESDVASLRAEMRRSSEEKQADLMLLFRQLESTVSGKESELRNLFVDIVRAELASYDSKDEMNARLADITARITQLTSANQDVRNKIELQKEYSDARVTNVMDDSNHLSVKIDQWNLKLEQLRAEFEAKLTSANDVQTSSAYTTSADIVQLQQVIEQLHSDIEQLKESASRTRTAGRSRDDEISQLRADMVYQQELDDVREHIDSVCSGVVSGAQSSGFGGDLSGLSNGQIEGMITKALATYHADRTGKTDYALESAGGSVVSIRCSETYSVKTAQLSIWGIPLWYTSSSPRSIIQPDVYPGQCWAMSGSTGYVVISLAATIHVGEFSLEHIPKSLAPDGDIKSAPKDFSVWGLEHLKDYPGKNFGNYTYKESGNPIQYFKVQAHREKTFDLVELRVNSNWGDPRYTCLYRFRVHGRLPSKLNSAQHDSS